MPTAHPVNAYLTDTPPHLSNPLPTLALLAQVMLRASRPEPTDQNGAPKKEGGLPEREPANSVDQGGTIETYGNSRPTDVIQVTLSAPRLVPHRRNIPRDLVGHRSSQTPLDPPRHRCHSAHALIYIWEETP